MNGQLQLTRAKKMLPDLKHVGTSSKRSSLHPASRIYGVEAGRTSFRDTLCVIVFHQKRRDTMRYKALGIIVVVSLLSMLSSCQNSGVGPALFDVSGTYAYQAFDSSGSASDSGTLIITQTDSTIGGEIRTNSISIAIQGEVNDTGYVQFTENPAKVLSHIWYGTDKGGVITGNVEVDTGGRDTPLSKQRFVATVQTP
jgi:hypothetical protein